MHHQKDSLSNFRRRVGQKLSLWMSKDSRQHGSTKKSLEQKD